MEVAVGSLLTHRHIQHVVVRGYQGGSPPPPPLPRGGPKLLGLFPEKYVVDLVLGRGVPGRGFNLNQPLGSLRALPRAETKVILEEGKQTYPRCPKCDMFVLKNP